ncbi:MAG: TIGR02450 family Trp-rich protein [Elainellaceae cyanobacterium]
MARRQRFPYLVGSKWTARQQTLGWRHFQVTNRKNQDKWVFAELAAACDPTVRFWLNAQALKDGDLWQAGWQPLADIAPNIAPDIAPNIAPNIAPDIAPDDRS